MNQLIDIARNDLEVADLLFKNKKYASSFYHYQQSVEKTTKYIGISSKSISEEQLSKNIKHDPTKVFSFLFKTFNEKANGFIPKISSHFITNLKQKIKSSSEKEIVLDALSALKQCYDEDLVIIKRSEISYYDTLKEWIKSTNSELFKSLLENEDEFVKVILEKKAEQTIYLINYGKIILSVLFINSLVCSKYKSDDFRYPNKTFDNPISYFEKNSELIKHIPYFIKTMEIPISYSPLLNWSEI